MGKLKIRAKELNVQFQTGSVQAIPKSKKKKLQFLGNFKLVGFSFNIKQSCVPVDHKLSFTDTGLIYLRVIKINSKYKFSAIH